MRPTATWFVVAGALFVIDALVLFVFGTNAPGPILSNLVQLGMGIVSVLACYSASRRSGLLGRYFWRLMTATFSIWVLGQSAGTYAELFSHPEVLPVSELMFALSGAPFGMALFLDPEHESSRFDRLHILDFLQVLLFYVTVYLRFSHSDLAPASGNAAWSRALCYDSVLTGSFLLRTILTDSKPVRRLFGRMLGFLALSTAADTYANYPGGRVWVSGEWFDLVWISLTLMPLLIAVTWHVRDCPESTGLPARSQSIIIQQFFPLLYPSLTFCLSGGVAATHPNWAVLLVVGSFGCFSGRLLVTQSRLQSSERSLWELNRRLAQLSSLDGLTSVANRRMFDQTIQEEWRRACRTDDALSLIMIDLDHFKPLNDAFGHQRGDECLVRIAAELKSHMRRSGDLVARFGGEEFVVLLPKTGIGEAMYQAERIRHAVESLAIQHPTSKSGVVTASFGVAAAAPDACPDAYTLLRAADQALYAAKRAGRNCVSCTPERAVA
ncbi:MAG: GGDEF domain-containing protein [Bryobacteraceae bacterium]